MATDQPREGYAPAATVSSLKSQDSTERLIASEPEQVEPELQKKIETKSVDDGRISRKVVVLLGLSQLVLGTGLAVAGAAAMVRGAALARAGAGLWAGGAAVAAGSLGLLAALRNCSDPLLTGFLALSLVAAACGQGAAVLAATGLQRDVTRHTRDDGQQSFEDEMVAWTPILANIMVLVVAVLECAASLATICQLSRRICPCLRPKTAFDHNQFDPGTDKAAPYLVQIVDESTKKKEEGVKRSERGKRQDLCRELEGRLQAELRGKMKEEGEFGSASSRSHLVRSWLGRQPAGARGPRGAAPPPPPPLLLLPAHPGHHGHHPHHAHHPTTLGRMPLSVMVPRRYATLPLPPPLYYPVHDVRVRRRRSPPAGRGPRRRRREGRGRRERDSQLTRSLERIHRRRRTDRERVSDAELKRTYTGLDRAYAEQFIAVCDESRSQAAERSDSLTTTSSELTDTRRAREYP